MTRDINTQTDLTRALGAVHTQTSELNSLIAPRSEASPSEITSAALENWIAASNSLTRAIEAALGAGKGESSSLKLVNGSERQALLMKIGEVLGENRSEVFTVTQLKNGGLGKMDQDKMTSLRRGGIVIRLGGGKYLLSQRALSYLATQAES